MWCLRGAVWGVTHRHTSHTYCMCAWCTWRRRQSVRRRVSCEHIKTEDSKKHAAKWKIVSGHVYMRVNEGTNCVKRMSGWCTCVGCYCVCVEVLCVVFNSHSSGKTTVLRERSGLIRRVLVSALCWCEIEEACARGWVNKISNTRYFRADSTYICL